MKGKLSLNHQRSRDPVSMTRKPPLRVFCANRYYITAVTSEGIVASRDRSNFTAVPILHGYRIYGAP